MASRTGAASSAGLFSPTRFGKFAKTKVSTADKEFMRLSSQEFIVSDKDRTKKYSLCRKCGMTRMTVNWDVVPSARVGLYGECRNGLDYRHHNWIDIRGSDFQALKNMDCRDRLNHYIFDLQEKEE